MEKEAAKNDAKRTEGGNKKDVVVYDPLDLS
jgi:hypothetical protein